MNKLALYKVANSYAYVPLFAIYLHVKNKVNLDFPN